MAKSKGKSKIWKIVGIVFGAFMLLGIIANITMTDEDRERMRLEEEVKAETKNEAKMQKEMDIIAKSQAKEEAKQAEAQARANKKAHEEANKKQKEEAKEAEKRAKEEAKNPTFANQWERLEYEIRNAKLLGIGKNTLIRDIKMNVFYEDLFNEEMDRRVVLIYLTDTNPNRKFMLSNVSQLLQIMHPYKDIYEIAIFFEPEDRASGTWLKYAIDGNVLRQQNPDHFRIDDLPKIASDYYLYPQLR